MMNCPLCSEPLRAVERQGIEIDHCLNCGGIWLDAGELDALIEREAVAALRQGERVLTRARRGREYDRSVYDTDETGARYGVLPTETPITFAVSAGDRRRGTESEEREFVIAIK